MLIKNIIHKCRPVNLPNDIKKLSYYTNKHNLTYKK